MRYECAYILGYFYGTKETFFLLVLLLLRTIDSCLIHSTSISSDSPFVHIHTHTHTNRSERHIDTLNRLRRQQQRRQRRRRRQKLTNQRSHHSTVRVGNDGCGPSSFIALLIDRLVITHESTSNRTC